jgi:hypothetical protein
MTLINPIEILEYARKQSAHLEQVPSWGPAFSAASAATPLLVRRLDKPDQYYYIVPFNTGAGVTARLRMNAQNGDYEEGIGIGKHGDQLPPYLTPDAAYRLITAKLAAEAKKQKKKGPPPVVAIEPFYGWKPCAQSFSAFLPFYVITSPTPRYVRVDGKTHERLTTGAGL